MLKILVVIANYGTKNDGFMRQLIAEYRALPYDVHLVVLTNVDKKVEGATEVVVHVPTGDPRRFPFAHRMILARQVERYDLFIYTEDDTLITHDNIEAFLGTTEVLAEDEIAGFLRTERAVDARISITTIHGHFRWDPTSVVKRAKLTFARFTNEHAASYILTRRQLSRALDSGGFLVPPHEDKYEFLETAATDPYTQCGLRKLICISQIERFLLPHLPNKYVGCLGIGADEFQQQIVALEEIAEEIRTPFVLFRTETQMPKERWSKRFYESPRRDIIESIAGDARTVLSYGCGSGALESELKAKGVEVTALPLDCVIGKCVEAKGIEVVYGSADVEYGPLAGRCFDGILLLDVLHLIPAPSRLITRLAGLLSSGGQIVVSVPNILHPKTFWKCLRGGGALPVLGGYERHGVHACSYWTVKGWVQAAGLEICSMHTTLPVSGPWWYRAAGQLFPPGFATDFVVCCMKARA